MFVLQRKSEDGAGDGGEEGKSSSSFVIPPEQEEKYEALVPADSPNRAKRVKGNS